MNQNHYLRSILLTALALPLFAQDPPAVTAPPKAQGPVLVVKTARPEVADSMAMGFDHPDELPDLAADAHYVLSLGADQKLKVETGTGDVGLMEVTADPAALMEMFAEQVEGGKAMFRGTMTLALQPQGLTPKDVAAFVDGMFAFPKQIQQLSLKVVGDPEAVTETGLDITLRMDPLAGSPFAATVEALQPCSQGAPTLPGDAAAMLHMQGSIAPASLPALFEPFLALTVRMTSQGDEQAQKTKALYEKFLKLYDGGFSASFGFPFNGYMLMGMLDGEAAQKMFASEEYLAVMKAQQVANRDMKMELTPNAFEHRGAKVMKSVMTNDGEPNPVMPDGILESYFTQIGTWFGGTLGGKDSDAKTLIDAIVDQKVKRAPLADGAVLHFAVDIHAFAAVMQAQMGLPADAEPDPDVPAKATMTLGKRDKGLRLHVHVK